MNITAIYPGTFDPVTNGHLDIIERAAGLFDQVIVAVADTASTGKSTCFDTAERVQLVECVIADLDNVSVLSFARLVTDVAREQNARVIVRGLRAVSDFEYEFQMAGMNNKLFPDAETVFLTPADHLNCISSSLVRQIAALGGDVSPFVHAVVNCALKKRL
ncbi:MAG: pantetheine-phosphate adenylyltransferase [Thiotrichales bacterium]|nr:pantetheine-phosphate adenylyltransferase [Thiotrichales bacterium]